MQVTKMQWNIFTCIIFINIFMNMKKGMAVHKSSLLYVISVEWDGKKEREVVTFLFIQLSVL